MVQGRALGQNVAPVQELGLSPIHLRTEYRTDPLGIDATAPRLSWNLGSSQRGQKQTAYQILVASDSAKLANDEADLWDTGKVESDDATGVAYAGRPLKSRDRCFWKVKVWDKNGKPSTWSAAAFWTMGLLAADDWKADWIGFDTHRGEVASSNADFGAARWIWHAADQGADKPKGHRLFVTEIDVPADSPVEEAVLLSVADDGHKFTINGTLAAAGTSFKVPVQTDVARFLKPGVNTLRVEVENGSPSPAGLLARLSIKLKDGRVIERVTDASWKTIGDPGATGTTARSTSPRSPPLKWSQTTATAPGASSRSPAWRSPSRRTCGRRSTSPSPSPMPRFTPRPWGFTTST